MPITGSGTFRLQAAFVTSQSGISGYAVGAGFIVGQPSNTDLLTICRRWPVPDVNYFTEFQSAGSILLNPDADGFFLNGSAFPTAYSALPPGFVPVTAVLNDSKQIGVGDEIRLRVAAFTSSVNAASFSYPADFSLEDLVAWNFGVDVETVVGSLFISQLWVTGTYNTVIYWWKLPDVTACGDKNTLTPENSQSHLIFSATQPPTPDGAFGEYEYFDLDDPVDGAPQPVITNLEPNHGRAVTLVTIWGDGFGDGATVRVDGVDVDDADVTVVSRYQIQFVAPVHANGYVNVQVINLDGVSS